MAGLHRNKLKGESIDEFREVCYTILVCCIIQKLQNERNTSKE